jgi:hypothetical protein
MGDHKFKETAAETKIEIPAEVAMQLKLMEFDQAIARAEEQVATFKKQRAEFVLNENVGIVKARFAKSNILQPTGIVKP